MSIPYFRLKSQSLKCRCNVDDCQFLTSSIASLKTHVAEQHPIQIWIGDCESCEVSSEEVSCMYILFKKVLMSYNQRFLITPQTTPPPFTLLSKLSCTVKFPSASYISPSYISSFMLSNTTRMWVDKRFTLAISHYGVRGSMCY